MHCNFLTASLVTGASSFAAAFRAFREDEGETEVDDFNGGIFALVEEEEVLRFQVSVTDSVRVAMTYRLSDLHENSSGFILSEVTFLDDSVEELTAFAQSDRGRFMLAEGGIEGVHTP